MMREGDSLDIVLVFTIIMMKTMAKIPKALAFDKYFVGII